MQLYWIMVIGNNNYEIAMVWEATDNKSNFEIQQSLIGWDWIDLAEDRDQWRALAKAVMNLRVP
jgi:hypothetical protein